MHVLNLVAVYEDRAVAEEARHKLLADGIAEADIRVSTDAGAGAPGRMTTASRRQESGGFLSWLFNLDDVSDNDRSWYGKNLEKRTAVSVRIEEAEAHRVREILDSCDPVDMGAEPATEHHRPTHAEASDPDQPNPSPHIMPGATGPASSAPFGGSGSHALETTPKMSDRTAGAGDQPPLSSGEDQVIPLVKEHLDVGKETVETRHRVRTYVVERPVEKTIPLRDERVVVERRPVTGEPSGMEGSALQGREFEVVERHERPVVDKKAAATEEVVIHKESTDRQETVRDTVRELEVDDKTQSDQPPRPRDDAGQKS